MRNNKKLEICIKHNEIMYIIGEVNKGFILQKQLREYAFLLEICKNQSEFKAIIDELVQFDIVKKIRFGSTNNQIVMLKKYGVRYIENKTGPEYNSSSVGAIKTCGTNQRYYKNIFHNTLILTMLNNPSMLKGVKTYGITEFLNRVGFNIYQDNIVLYKSLKELGGDEKVIDNHIAILEQERKHRKEIADKSRKSRLKLNTYEDEAKPQEATQEEEYQPTEEEIQARRRLFKVTGEDPGVVRLSDKVSIVATNIEDEDDKAVIKSKSQSRRDNLMKNGTLETLKRKDCYIRLHTIKNRPILTLMCLDWGNNQNKLNIIEKLSVLAKIGNFVFSGVSYDLRLTLIVTNSHAEENLKTFLEDTNAVEKMMKEHYGMITNLNTHNYKVNIVNADIDKNYLGNRKLLSVYSDKKINKKEK